QSHHYGEQEPEGRAQQR
ncbi:hypothetical protein BN1723_020975, partial [Verticillium longisporum]